MKLLEELELKKNVFAYVVTCRSMSSTWRSMARESHISWGLRAGPLGDLVRSRVSHTVHVEKARRTDSFMIDPENCVNNKDDMLTKSRRKGSYQ